MTDKSLEWVDNSRCRSEGFVNFLCAENHLEVSRILDNAFQEMALKTLQVYSEFFSILVTFYKFQFHLLTVVPSW